MDAEHPGQWVGPVGRGEVRSVGGASKEGEEVRSVGGASREGEEVRSVGGASREGGGEEVSGWGQ